MTKRETPGVETDPLFPFIGDAGAKCRACAILGVAQNGKSA